MSDLMSSPWAVPVLILGWLALWAVCPAWMRELWERVWAPHDDDT